MGHVGNYDYLVDNKYGGKNWSSEQRQEAYSSLCSHIGQGYDIDSWCFERDYGSISWRTMLTWIKDFPEEFQAEQKSIAQAQSKRVWEDVLMDSARGNNTKANIAAIQMIMRNKFGWDKRPEALESTQDQLQSFRAVMALLEHKQTTVGLLMQPVSKEIEEKS